MYMVFLSFFTVECDENHFGINCAHECHCKANDTCSKVNGLCSPQGGCHEDWIGSGCQTRELLLRTLSDY